MSVQAWASNMRLSGEYHSSIAQRLVDIYENLLGGQLNADQAAHSISSELEPTVKQNPSDLQIISVWGILCRAARDLGSDPEASKRLADLVSVLGQIRVKDDEGRDVHFGSNVYWVDLPSFALTFREYGIAIEPDDEEMDTGEWIAQKTPLVNATSFAATALVRCPRLSGMAFYIAPCMMELEDLQRPDPSLSPDRPSRATVHVPAASTWILIAGQKIYDMSGKKEWGLNLESWKSWHNAFKEVAVDDEIEQQVRDIAARAGEEMAKIEQGS